MNELTTEDIFDHFELRVPIRTFDSKQKSILLKYFKTNKDLIFGIQNLKYLPNDIPFDLKVKSLDYNLKNRHKIDAFLEKEVYLGNEFKFNFERKITHIESMNQINVLNKNNEIILTFNPFFILREKNTPTLMVNNLQAGFFPINSGNKKQERLAHLRAELNKLNKTLGQNWRIYFIKKINEFALKNKNSFIFRLPPRYDPIYNKSPEYIRQIRQYIQTAIKAGIPAQNIDLSLVNSEVKERFELNLKNKNKNQGKQKKLQEKKKLREAGLKINKPRFK